MLKVCYIEEPYCLDNPEGIHSRGYFQPTPMSDNPAHKYLQGTLALTGVPTNHPCVILMSEY